jgi:hypothetical protein
MHRKDWVALQATAWDYREKEDDNMANMSYCRFRNTEGDLHDCYDALWEDVSAEEHCARARLIAMCKDIAEEVGDEDWLMDLNAVEGD